MDNNSKTQYKWSFDPYKVVKIIKASEKVSFQRKGSGVYNRGITISKDAFYKMDDVTLTPGLHMELEPNVVIINYGSRISLVKYCMTKDNKRCEGGFFNFTTKEWFYFWNNLRGKVKDAFQNM